MRSAYLHASSPVEYIVAVVLLCQLGGANLASFLQFRSKLFALTLLERERESTSN